MLEKNVYFPLLDFRNLYKFIKPSSLVMMFKFTVSLLIFLFTWYIDHWNSWKFSHCHWEFITLDLVQFGFILIKSHVLYVCEFRILISFWWNIPCHYAKLSPKHVFFRILFTDVNNATSVFLMIGISLVYTFHLFVFFVKDLYLDILI
jgi:hypothetical protein